MFISDDKRCKPAYNDVKFPYAKEYMDFAKEQSKVFGVEDMLGENFLKHIGFLFSRDALVIYQKLESQDKKNSTANFEQFQSTNWNSVRFKPPPSQESPIGFRVEFRSMDVQLTPSENSAYLNLVSALARIIIDQKFSLNFYIPMSLIHENFRRANLREAAVKQKFWFRKHVMGPESDKDEFIELSIAEILAGNSEFIGLTKVVEEYMKFSPIPAKEKEQNKKRITTCTDKLGQNIFYSIEFLLARAKGELLTMASFIRNFVMKHPDYKKDSIVSQKINNDLCERLCYMSKNFCQTEKVIDYYKVAI